MKPMPLHFLYAGVLLAWLGLLWAGHRGPGPATPSATLRAAADEKHYVTLKQLLGSGASARQPAPPFAAPTHDGQTFRLEDALEGQPLVLIFIKNGCPCSVEAEPHFHQVLDLYQGHVRFAGVIDGTLETARQYARDQRVPYPVLADPERAIIRAYRAESSVYVAVIRPDGVIDQLWPGYSAEMMRELGRRIAELSETQERRIDVRGIPTVLTTGCPFLEAS